MIQWFKSIPKSVYILTFFGTLLCVFTNEINRNQLNSPLKDQFGMVQTSDEPSYIVPPQNWIKKGVWKDNSDGVAAYVQRPPGYGILYMLNYLILGKSALLGLKIMQILFFFFGGLIFWRILDELDIGNGFKWIALSLFVLLPSYSGFVYYSMTEGVTPFFTLWLVLESLVAARTRKATLSLFLSFAFLLLIRPQLAFLPLALFIFHFAKRNWRVVVVVLLACIPISGWYLRTAMISGESLSMHPIYFKTNNSLYRPTHAALTDLYRVWEWRSNVFHTHMGIASRGDSTQIRSLRKEIPSQLRADVLPLLHRFGALNQYRKAHFAGKKIENYFEGEVLFIKEIKRVRSKLISENAFLYYLVTPARSTQEFLNKSYMNLYIFQSTFRGKFVVESMRIVCWLVFISSFGFFMLTPFLKKFGSFEFYLFIGTASFLFYLVFFQRLNEERYIVPFLPIFLIFGLKNVEHLIQKLKCLRKKS